MGNVISAGFNCFGYHNGNASNMEHPAVYQCYNRREFFRDLRKDLIDIREGFKSSNMRVPLEVIEVQLCILYRDKAYLRSFKLHEVKDARL